ILLACAAPLWAHVMSMSTGDINVQGNRAEFELRMPLYELAHVKSPDTKLFEHIHFSTAGQQARLVRKACREDPAQASYVCSASYEFPVAVDRLAAECTFHSITVPNHVFLLRALRDGKSDQAIFDFSFTKAEIRFDPPSALETAVTQTFAGMMRAGTGMVQILFLAALVLAARSRAELAAVTVAFLAGQIGCALIAPLTRWEPAPRFVEAATALTIAYLAVEILALPQAGKRWLIAAVLGVFHGLYFDLFLRSSDYHAGYVLAGAAFVEVAIIGLFALLFARLGCLLEALRPLRVSAAMLLCVGMFWFFLRLRS
ncbi:MAG: HupE/UreJ family protein, partial [Bryobacteraceae bacterium]